MVAFAQAVERAHQLVVDGMLTDSVEMELDLHATLRLQVVAANWVQVASRASRQTRNPRFAHTGPLHVSQEHTCTPEWIHST
jgi:hypothetical protein